MLLNRMMNANDDFGGGGRGGDLFSRKIYAMPECIIVDIGMHSNCVKNRIVHIYHDSKNGYIQSLHDQSVISFINGVDTS